MIKLHLGCGTRYLTGYVNIDFPPSQHTVQKTSVADQYADISSLKYPPGSVEEVRLHHVFEHFPRPVACALVASWNSWLRPGGILHIEVPDLNRMALTLVNPFASLQCRLQAERHLFGSHEAGWAAHKEGYDNKSLSYLLQVFGFETISIAGNSWKGTHNIEIRGKKVRSYTRDEARISAREYLSHSLIDDSESEQDLLVVWMNDYDNQAARSFSLPGTCDVLQTG